MIRHLRPQDLGRGGSGVDGQHPPAGLQEGKRLPPVAESDLDRLPRREPGRIDGGEIKTIEIDSDGGPRRRFRELVPRWRMDCLSGRASKSVDLYIVRVDGTQLHQVTDTPIGKYEDAADWTAAAP